jgi:nucleotide-binding universal stress UspA family protein
MAVIGTIAVGFDGSVSSDGALGWAIDLAMQTGASLVVVHALGLLGHSGDPTDAFVLEESMLQLVQEHQFPVSRIRWCPMEGDPCTVLLGAAEAPLCADLVVVGSRGRGMHAGMLLGSTSAELVQHSRIPILIVPDNGQDPGLG